MSIPKKIHYVWLGGQEKPRAIKRCMKTWKKLKGYEFIEWNENNIDIESHPFLKEAVAKKKWAFASDYIRAWAIYNYGGVYFDTDIIVVKSINSLLKNRAFVGFETPDYPFTAVFGAEKKHPFVKDMLDFYNGRSGKFDFKDNNTISTSELLIKKYDCELGNKEQELKTGIHVYPDGVLCAPSPESITIHAMTKTWRKGLTLKDWLLAQWRTRLDSRFLLWLYWQYRKLKRH